MLSILENIPLAKYTTYKVGGCAQYFAEPQSISELQELLIWRNQQNLSLFILGKGSNLVVSDSGYKGLVLYFGRHLKNITINNTKIIAECGALLHSVVQKSVDSGISGLQHLGGIPGTVGGGVYINAGAFEQELKQTITKVTSVDLNGNLIHRTNEECGFSYRHSNFFALDEIIVETEFEGTKTSTDSLKAEFLDTLRKRKDKQPLEIPNAGSMYKRPTGTFAGKLIQEANLKGYSVGGAQISPKHANFVLNFNNATAQNIYDLSEDVIDQVLQNSGIRLEKEQIFLGEFLPWPR